MRENGNNMNIKRVCAICEKVFKSGKALGGHMRSHLQITLNKQNRRQAAAAAAAATGGGDCGKSCSCRCVICGKNFPSMKSLFGHMRCHPDRDWRGINPPPSFTSSSSSSSSSLSDVNNNSGKREGAVDLTESLRGWALTAKRGRKATETEDDDRLRDAVTFLMMLAEGDDGKHNSSEGEVDIYEGRESDEMKVLNNMKTKTKKRKKVKQLCDLNLMEIDKCNTVFHTSKGVVLDFDLNEEPPLEL